MAINPLYIPLFNIEEVILDKDSGLPLAGGIVTFYRDSQRLTPKPVFQIAGTSPNYTFVSLGNQLTLGLSGTFVDQDGDPMVPYAFPYDSEGNLDLYYVTVVSAGGVPQFVRQAVPYVDTGSISPSELLNTENQLSNPQFVEVNIMDPGISTITVTGSNTVTSIAPDWDIITTGSGTLTVERLQPTSAGVVTNPPFALRIDASSGLGSTFQLRQRLLNSPSIFRNGFLSGSITAAVISGGGSFISMDYIPSTGTPTAIIPSTSIPTDGAYHIIAANAAIPDQSNDPAEDGYVDISITLPTARNIAITSIQVVGTAIAVNIPFDQQTAARQVDHLFNYYEKPLIAKQIPSFLVGWDFAVNPFQLGNSGSLATTAAYIADQTIALRGSSGNVTFLNSLVIGELVFTTAGTNDSFYMMQYLTGDVVRDMIGTKLSCNVFAYNNTGASPVVMRVYLLRGSSAASIPALPTSIGTVDTAGVFTVSAANWTEIPRSSLPTAQVTVSGLTVASDINNGTYDYGFTGWEITDSTQINDTDKFAIVVTFGYRDAATVLAVKSISVVPGILPCRPAIQSFDQALSQCQHYYEKSYDSNVVPGSASTSGQLMAQQQVDTNGAGSLTTFARTFGISYKTPKRTASSIVNLYSPSGVISNVQLVALTSTNTQPINGNVVSTNWSQLSGGKGNTVFAKTSTASMATAAGTYSYDVSEAYILFHFTADARLGIV